ncbi:hypothetical protein QW131_10255 [Roseibium salinum]|nr:hypothetical protein [Roseibium salinum]
MLDALRRGAGTWIAKLFIALLILSFGIWGITGFFPRLWPEHGSDGRRHRGHASRF